MRGGDSDCRCRTQCVQEIGRKRAKILVKYDDALGRRAKVMIGKSQDRLHRHGIFSTSGPIGHRSRRRCQRWSSIADFVIVWFYGRGHKPLIPCLGGTLGLLTTKTRQRDNANAATVSFASLLEPNRWRSSRGATLN